jgi:hypothetical protein
MKSLQQILKSNGQNLNNAYQTGKLEFDMSIGCLVYRPSRVNEAKRKNFQTESRIKKINGGS